MFLSIMFNAQRQFRYTFNVHNKIEPDRTNFKTNIGRFQNYQVTKKVRQLYQERGV